MTDYGCKLYIHGVNKKMGKGELFAEFEKFGRVTDVCNTGKGFAFVTFAMKDMATMALRKMNGATMNGQTIVVDFAQPRKNEGRHRDRFYGRRHGGSEFGWVGDGSVDTGGESEGRRGHGIHGDGRIDRDNWRSGEDSYSNVVNIFNSKDDTDKDDFAWRVSSGIDNISDVDSEAEECPIILKAAESLVKGRVERVKVISASSPGHVVGRPVVWEDQYYRMIDDLTAYCEVTSPTARIKVGMGVNFDKLGWTRARIMLMMEHKVELYLCDYGYNVTLTSESLHLLLPRHAVLPHLAPCFHVCGVVAAGGGGGWTRSAKIMTRDLLEIGEVEVTVVDHTPVIDANLPFLPSYPADIYIIEKVTMGPMDPITTTRINLTHTLRMAGLALPRTILDIPFICKHLKENGSGGDVRNIKETWREEEEQDDIENIEDRDKIVAIHELKFQKLVVVNEGENFADMGIVEERGLRGKH